MTFPKIKILWRLIAKVFLTVFVIATLSALIAGVYLFGLVQGYNLGQTDAEGQDTALPTATTTPTLTPTPPVQNIISPASVNWGGPELWEAVNKRRKEFGVNPLSQRDELCTIASIRLNELLELGKLDGHEGFSNMSETRPDLKWVFDKYSSIAEFLAQGGQSPQETVSLWENTLGHKKLLTGGEYVWGCIYAQNTFAVAITAF